MIEQLDIMIYKFRLDNNGDYPKYLLISIDDYFKLAKEFSELEPDLNKIKSFQSAKFVRSNDINNGEFLFV